MRSVIKVFFIIGCLVIFAGCRFSRDPVVDEVIPVEAKQVVADLGDFLSDEKNETIELNRSDVEVLLIALGYGKTGAAPQSSMKDLTVTLEPVKRASAGIPGTQSEKGEQRGGGEAALASEAKALPLAAPTASLPDAASSTQKLAGVGGVQVPEGFQAEITEPTTGAKFFWDGKRNWWRSDEFEAYLKGSKAQNDSFCWLLTTNSQGVENSDIPDGWSFQALGNGKGIVIAREGSDLTMAQESDGDHSSSPSQVSERPANQPVVASVPVAINKTAVADELIPTKVESPEKEEAVKDAAEPTASLPAPSASSDAVAPGVVGAIPVPDGFQAEIIEPTTRAKFLWDGERGWWRSDEFERYLKGSKAQNDSFCWLLTANSQSAGVREIPEGWTFRPLGDGKGIVLAGIEANAIPVRAIGAGEMNGLETPAIIADEIKGEKEKGIGVAGIEAAAEKTGAVATTPSEPINEVVTPSQDSVAKIREIPEIVSDPPAVRRPEEVSRAATPVPQEKSLYLPPGTELPDGRVPYAGSEMNWFRQARQPQFPVEATGNGGTADENPQNSGNTGERGSVDGTSSTESLDSGAGNPEANTSSRPRLKIPFFNSRKAKTSDVIPEEQKTQSNE